MDEYLIRQNVIAIDGPAGAGKSTVAKEVARRLEYIYIDTGAMYRALALKALQMKINMADETAITELAKNTDISIAHADDKSQLIFVDGHDVTIDIRSPIVSANVSLVAKVPGVRNEMVSLQRQLASLGRVVMDGRDIGTNVMPKAQFKFFITASVEERARRRYVEMCNQGYDVDFAKLKSDISSRDQMDQQRATAPLIQAKDAILIDTSEMTIVQVVEQIINLVKQR